MSVEAALKDSGFVFAEAPELRAALGDALRDWSDFRGELGRSGARYVHGRWRALPEASACRVPRRTRRDRAQGEPATLSKPRLQRAEWRHRALVRPDAGPCRRHIVVPAGSSTYCNTAVQRASRRCRPGMSRCINSASRRARMPAGRPTPEGMHQDGVDWVLVLMVDRDNIAEGETSIHGLDKQSARQLHAARAARFCALVDDHRVFHGVTPVRALDPARHGASGRAGGDVPPGNLSRPLSIGLGDREWGSYRARLSSLRPGCSRVRA